MPVLLPGCSMHRIRTAGRPLYEQDLLSQATGDAIRPGGTELTARLLERCELQPGARLLDVGCGRGASLEWLKAQNNYIPVGVDYSALLLREASRRSLNVARSTGIYLPFSEASFDAALFECCLSVISIQAPQDTSLISATISQVLQETLRVLRPGGWLLLSDLYARRPEGISKLRAMAGSSCLRGVLDLFELFNSIQKTGFEIYFWEDHSTALRQLNSKLCQAYGSLDAFWGQAAGEPVDTFDLLARIGRARPGYFILLAQNITETSHCHAVKDKKPQTDHEAYDG